MSARVVVPALFSAVSIVGCFSGSSGTDSIDGASFGGGTIHAVTTGQLRTGMQVEVRDYKTGSCRKAKYLGFWTKPGLETLVAIEAVQYPDGRRDLPSDLSVRPYQGCKPLAGACRSSRASRSGTS